MIDLDDVPDKHPLDHCTHFKTDGHWFFVSGSIRGHFLKIFKVEEAIRLEGGNGPRGPSIGKVMVFPQPIKLYFASDILHYLSKTGREAELSKAYSPKRIKEIHASLMVQQVHTI